MSYILKHYDSDLLKFNIEKTFDGITIEPLWINQEKKNMLPLGMSPDAESLKNGLRQEQFRQIEHMFRIFLQSLV